MERSESFSRVRRAGESVFEYGVLGYVSRSPAGAHNAMCSLFRHSGSFCRLRACVGRYGDLVLWCGRMLLTTSCRDRLRMLRGRDIGYAFCVVSV